MTFRGRMAERVRFERRADVADGYGSRQGEWDENSGFERWANFVMRPGSEAVTAARLEGRQPLTAVIYLDACARQITSDWRMIELRTGRVFAIHAVEDMQRDGRFLSIVCESGVAP